MRPTSAPDQVVLAKRVIQNMMIDYQHSDIPNPALMKFFNHLEALALDSSEEPKTEDLAEPSPALLDVASPARLFDYRVFGLC